MKKLMRLLWLEEAEAFGMQVYVLKDGEEVVGAFGITGNQKSKLSVSFIAKVLAALRTIGLSKLITFGKIGMEASRKPSKDELYIDFLAVKESRQNEHIGHQLTENIDRLKKTSPKINKLSLYVLKNNEPARHLYEKFGFRRSRKSGLSTYYFMVKR